MYETKSMTITDKSARGSNAKALIDYHLSMLPVAPIILLILNNYLNEPPVGANVFRWNVTRGTRHVCANPCPIPTIS